jgi:hypothetical protein
VTFGPSLIFAGKVRSLPIRAESFKYISPKCRTQMRFHGRTRANKVRNCALKSRVKMKLKSEKDKSVTWKLNPGPNVIKLFTSVIYGCS